jgi:hypothetical protein
MADVVSTQEVPEAGVADKEVVDVVSKVCMIWPTGIQFRTDTNTGRATASRRGWSCWR